MDCRQVDRLMEANLDGRLTGFERVALRQHLRICHRCRAKVDAMTAFAATVERTLAGVEGPDWGRLAPPTLPRVVGLREPPPAPPPIQPAASPQLAAASPGRDKRPRSVFGLVLVALALAALVVPFWDLTPAPTRSPLAEALAVEATRQMAGSRPDLITDDFDEARNWLAERGFVDAPLVALPPGIDLGGAYLMHYDGSRVAGLELITADGPMNLHLRAHEVATSPALEVVAADGLEALGRQLGAWQFLVIAPAGMTKLSPVASAVAEVVRY